MCRMNTAVGGVRIYVLKTYPRYPLLGQAQNSLLKASHSLAVMPFLRGLLFMISIFIVSLISSLCLF